LKWKTDTPVWIEQWPLKRESLEQAHRLVQEQFSLGHLRLSTSPWNTPVFVIPKKTGKYRLLHDLRAVNKQMQEMGALQPGLPNPAMIPERWHLLIVDLKDCFFTISLHEEDKQRFAFTLPSLNRERPDQRFEWTVLPQGMRNSPTLCQLYVDDALQPVRKEWREALIYHYMDDILLAQANPIRWRRTVTEALTNTCDDNVQLWSKWEIIFASFFTPGVAAARAHRNLETLSCWVVKQANMTSRILSELATEMDNVQHAVLQNRMPIDFLLLAHGHGCEDFDGMCCMDLEDNSSSIHREIKQLMDHSQKIQKDVGVFGLEGLANWLGLGGWIKGIIQSLLMILIIVILGLVIFSCTISCVKRIIIQTTHNIWLDTK